jgi:protease IV
MKRAILLGGLALSVACGGRARPSDNPEDGREPAEKETRLIALDLGSGFPETSRGGLLQLPATRTYTGLVRAIERAADDPLTAGVFVRLGAQGVDYARSEELGELLERFRKKGKSVVCHAHAYTNASSWLVARGCSRVWLSAAGSVDTVGLAAQLVHLKGLLDRLKVGVDILHVGKYKSGGEPLTREEPSEYARTSLQSTLASMRSAWLDSAESARAGLKIKLEQGPYGPEEAKAIGLVDAVGFESEALAEAKKLAKTQAVSHVFGPKSKKGGGLDVGTLIRVLTGSDDEGSGKPHIAVVPAEGAIGMDASGPLDGPGITAQALNRTLKKLAKDDSVKAVVLRIDSPGGSPLASDLIWHELMELRKKKTVIASVGSMAASGGYYIACGAQRIVAERTSIVGSIGVFGGKVVIGPALHEVGINTFTVPASTEPGAEARATYLSPFTPWDDATRARVQAQMQGIYDLFVARVAEARKMPVDEVRLHAEGRIWSGEQGKERGLVDEFGGLASALELARKLAKLDRDTPVTVEGAKEGLLEMLALGGGEATEAEIHAAVARFEARHALLAELPVEWRGSVASLSPLARGENVVAALPFALSLH